MDTPQVPVTPPSSPNNTTVMGVLSYLGILVIIPYLMSKDNSFVKFHVKQGIVLVVIELVLWVASGMLWGLLFLINIIQLAVFVLSIIGIVNVVQNKEKELPLVGSFAKYVTI